MLSLEGFKATFNVEELDALAAEFDLIVISAHI